jgi:hypothetical protein
MVYDSPVTAVKFARRMAKLILEMKAVADDTTG